MRDMRPTVRSWGRRLRVRDAVDRSSRFAFHAALAGGGLLLAGKLLGLPIHAVYVLAAWGALAAGLLAAEFLKPFGLRDAARMLDRRLGLEERLSTALEAEGPMREPVAADAAAALARTSLPPWRPARDVLLSGAALLALAALAAAPTLDRRRSSDEVRLERLAQDAAAKLAAMAPERVEFAEIAERMAVDPEGTIVPLEALRARLAEEMARGGPGAAEARRLYEGATAAAEGLGAELARQGRASYAARPAAAEAKLRSQLAAEAAGERADGLPPLVRVMSMRSAQVWDPRHDHVVLNYYRGTR
ncbi:MAG TPA: hypothetical protein VEJ18_21750 [Planctomycetota bacterium]|nr:hypothetical protein [Planctomycetota bacterium]